MHNTTRHETPLLGALCVAEALITQAQLEACLLLQSETYPQLTLGQVLHRCGYVTKADISRMLRLQADLRGALLIPAAEGAPPEHDLLVLALWPHEDPELREAFAAAGAAVSFAPTLQILLAAEVSLKPELLLVDAEMAEAGMPQLQSVVEPIIAISSAARGLRGQPIPNWMRVSLKRTVALARSRRATQGYQALEQQLTFELQMAAGIRQHLEAAQTPGEAVRQLMLVVRDRFAVEAGTLYRYDDRAGTLAFELVFGPYQALLQQMTMPANQGIAGWVFQHEEPVIIPDARRDARFNAQFDQRTGFETRSLLCVPLWAGGRPWGVLQLINKLDGAFTAVDLMVLRMLADVVSSRYALEEYEIEDRAKG